jgi:hypothetical protein
MRFPEVDYEAHPAYSPYRCVPRFDEQHISQCVAAADLAYSEYGRNETPSERDIEHALAQIRASTSQIVTHVRRQQISAIAEEWLCSCVRWAIADIAYELTRVAVAKREYRSLPLLPRQTAQLASMRSQGMYITSLPQDAYERMRRLALMHREELKLRAERDPFNRAVINVPFNSPLWKVIKNSAKEAGIVDVLSEQKGNRMTMLGAGLEYSSPHQRWYQSLYADVGLQDGPYQYLHIDEGYCLPKAMIYVTAVGAENGPTRAIPGSNSWECSEFRLRMHRALDRIVGDRYDQYSVAGAYRSLARRPELRQIFMALPAAFRGSSHFGDDVLPDSNIANALEGREVPYLSESAQALVFDGPNLLHRGSLVRDGERMALQVIFRNRSEARIRARLSNESFVKDQLALTRKYLRKFVMGYL